MGYKRVIISKDPEILNYFINHEDIRGGLIGYKDYIDGSALLAQEDTYFFVFDGGCLLLWSIGDNIYEADIYFLPRKRGALAKKAALEVINHMFAVLGAKRIEVQASRLNAPSRHLAVNLGFKRMAVNDDVIRYEMERDRWVE